MIIKFSDTLKYKEIAIFLARKSDLVLINKMKRTYHSEELAVPTDYWVKGNKAKDWQILGSCQRTIKLVEHKCDSDTICSWCTRNSSQMLGKKTGGIGDQRNDRDYTNRSIVKIGLILRKVLEIWGDLLSLKLQWKTVSLFENLWREKPTKKCNEIVITAASNSSDNIRTNRTTIIRKQKREEKQMYESFEVQTDEISCEKTCTSLRKRNLKRETESLLIVSQNNTVGTNQIKAKAQ